MENLTVIDALANISTRKQDKSTELNDLLYKLRAIQIENLKKSFIIEGVQECLNTSSRKYIDAENVHKIIVSRTIDEHILQTLNIKVKPLNPKESSNLQLFVVDKIIQKRKKVADLQPSSFKSFSAINKELVLAKQNYNLKQIDYIQTISRFGSKLNEVVEQRCKNIELFRNKIEEIGLNTSCLLIKLKLSKLTFQQKIFKENQDVEKAVQVAISDLHESTESISNKIETMEKYWNKVKKIDPASDLGMLIASYIQLQEYISRTRSEINDGKENKVSNSSTTSAKSILRLGTSPY